MPADTLTVIYYCHVCKGKHTFGLEYFTEVGTPDTCPNCNTHFEQGDKILRTPEDTEDDLDHKRDELRRKRGEKVKIKERPADPAETKRARIKELEDEVKRLKGEDPKEPSGIRLGP